MISIVESGEASGTLEDVIGKLANQFHGDAKIQGKVISALVYPMVLLVLTVCAVTAMLVFILPTFVGMFEESGTQLPALTAAVMALSNFIVTKWYIIIIAIVFFSTLISRFIATPTGRMLRDKLYLRLPIVKNVVVNVASSGFARTMSNLVSSGLPLINGIDITARVVNNAVIEEKLMEMRDDIRTGMSLSYGVKKIAVFPPIVHSMMAIGEESGDLDNLLSKLSEYLDEEVEASIERLMAMMEPLLIIVMGACIGTVVVSMLLPIFGIYDVIGQ
jgi:type IV pilus assembly protein PilC